MRLIFIRHGETAINVRGLTHITNDFEDLTEVGMMQAKKAGKFCKEKNVNKIYCSPEQRAQTTAKIISNILEISYKVIGELRERNWGDWEGKPWNEIKQILDTKSLEERYTFIPPNGESWKQMEKRLKQALSAIISNNDETIAIVTHGGTLRGLIPILNNSPKEISFKYDFANGSVTTFDYIEGQFKEILVNDISHL